MGHGTRNGTIQTFQPDDTETDLYIKTHFTAVDGADIWQKMQTKWPGIKVNEFDMEAEYIHTDCLTYDLYDASDYTNFIHITAWPQYFSRIEEEKEETSGKQTTI